MEPEWGVRRTATSSFLNAVSQRAATPPSDCTNPRTSRAASSSVCGPATPLACTSSIANSPPAVFADVETADGGAEGGAAGRLRRDAADESGDASEPPDASATVGEPSSVSPVPSGSPAASLGAESEVHDVSGDRFDPEPEDASRLDSGTAPTPAEDVSATWNSASIAGSAGTRRIAASTDLKSDICRFSGKRRRSAMHRCASRGFRPTDSSQGPHCPCASRSFAVLRASPSSQASSIVFRTAFFSAAAPFLTRSRSVLMRSCSPASSPLSVVAGSSPPVPVVTITASQIARFSWRNQSTRPRVSWARASIHCCTH